MSWWRGLWRTMRGSLRTSPGWVRGAGPRRCPYPHRSSLGPHSGGERRGNAKGFWGGRLGGHPAGSAHILGRGLRGQEGPIDERSGLNSRLHPRERYARSKRESDLVVREVSEGKGKGMAVAVLRPCALYGERDRVLTPKLVQSLRLLIHPRLGGGRTTMSVV